jgi:hypothetical protein
MTWRRRGDDEVAPVMEDADSGSDALPDGVPAVPCSGEVVDKVRRGERLRLVAAAGRGSRRGSTANGGGAAASFSGERLCGSLAG